MTAIEKPTSEPKKTKEEMKVDIEEQLNEEAREKYGKRINERLLKSDESTKKTFIESHKAFKPEDAEDWARDFARDVLGLNNADKMQARELNMITRALQIFLRDSLLDPNFGDVFASEHDFDKIDGDFNAYTAQALASYLGVGSVIEIPQDIDNHEAYTQEIARLNDRELIISRNEALKAYEKMPEKERLAIMATILDSYLSTLANILKVDQQTVKGQLFEVTYLDDDTLYSEINILVGHYGKNRDKLPKAKEFADIQSWARAFLSGTPAYNSYNVFFPRAIRDVIRNQEVTSENLEAFNGYVNSYLDAASKALGPRMNREKLVEKYFGGELLPAFNLEFRKAFNYMLRQKLKPEQIAEWDFDKWMEMIVRTPWSQLLTMIPAELYKDIEAREKARSIEELSQQYAVQTLGYTLRRHSAWTEDLSDRLDSADVDLKSMDPDKWDFLNNNYWRADEFFDFEELAEDAELAGPYQEFKKLYTDWKQKAAEYQAATQNPFEDEAVERQKNLAYVRSERILREKLAEMQIIERRRLESIEEAYANGIADAWRSYSLPDDVTLSTVFNTSFAAFGKVHVLTERFEKNIKPWSIYTMRGVSGDQLAVGRVRLKIVNEFLDKFFPGKNEPIASIKDANQDNVAELNEYFAGMSAEEAIASVNNAIYLRNALNLEIDLRKLQKNYVDKLDSGLPLDEKEKAEEAPEEAVPEEEVSPEEADMVAAAVSPAPATAVVASAPAPVTELVAEGTPPTEEAPAEEEAPEEETPEEAPVAEEVVEEGPDMTEFGQKYEKFLAAQFNGSDYMAKLNGIDGFEDALLELAKYAKTDPYYSSKKLEDFTPQQWFRLIQDSGQSLRVLIPPSIRHKA